MANISAKTVMVYVIISITISTTVTKTIHQITVQNSLAHKAHITYFSDSKIYFVETYHVDLRTLL